MLDCMSQGFVNKTKKAARLALRCFKYISHQQYIGECQSCFKYISHQQLIVPSLYICFQIICAVLIVNVVVLTITEIRPRDQTDAVEHVSHLTTNITGPQSSANVLTRSKRQGLKRLREYCPGWSSGNYSDPCVDAIFNCYGYSETVCKAAHASCASAVKIYNYPKCEPDKINYTSISIDGQEEEAIQTLNCRCGSSSY